MSALAANKQGRRRSVIKVIQDDGSEYFHNEDTGESTWEVPEGYDVIVHEDSIEKHKAKVQEKTRRQSRLSQQLERLRKTRAGGWETCLDNTTGKLYYWHRESGKTQWSIPDPIREARRKAKAESGDAEASSPAATAESKAAAGGEESGSDTRSAKALWRRASFRMKIVNRVKRLSRPRRTNIMSKDSSDPEHAAEIAAGMEPIDKPDEVRAMIKKAMDGNFVFQMLPKRTVRMMIDVMEGRQVDARTTIIEQGDKGDFFYVIEEGSCDVLVDGNNVATLQPGRSFGELALFYNCPRNASIVAKTECFLWQIDRERFKALMVSGAIQDSSAALTALKSIPWLEQLEGEQLGRVASACQIEEFPANHTIINKGEHGDKFYIIKSGMVKCKIDKISPALFLGQSKFFGELALLRDQPRAADVIAVRNTECLSLTRHAFHVLLGSVHSQLQREYGGVADEEAPSKAAAPARLNRSKTEESVNPNGYTLEDLQLGPVLGEGTFGRVQLVTAPDKTKWALKIMMKAQIVEMGQTKATMLEKEVMCRIRHPLCLQLEATFMNEKLLYMLLEIVHGGELFQLLADSETGVVPPSTAIFYAACVIDAFSYLHGKGIVYRDLKPENLLLDKDGYLKVIDYGFAKFLTDAPYKTFTFCGTPEYFAPEMMHGQGYAHSVDTWGVGILIYEMLYGFTPFADFDDNDPRKTMRYIIKNEVEFPSDGIKAPVMEELIKGLLMKKTVNRLGCGEKGIGDVKSHDAYKSFDWAAFYDKRQEAPWKPTLSGPDGVVETSEEYDSYETYMANTMPYSGDQRWCATW